MHLMARTIDFVVGLAQDQNNLQRVPGWVSGIPGVDGAALGIAGSDSSKVHISLSPGFDTHTIELTVEHFECLQPERREQSEHLDVPCDIINCPMRQRALILGNPMLNWTTCFPIPGKKGFLMAWGKGILDTSSETLGTIKAVAYAIGRSSDPANHPRETCPAIVPTEDLAHMWSEVLAGLSHDLRTPLACIKGYATTLLRMCPGITPLKTSFFRLLLKKRITLKTSLVDYSILLPWAGRGKSS